jgi:ribosome biogenesis GTPase
MRARVVRSTGSYYNLLTEVGDDCIGRLSGKMRLESLKHTNPVSVGDWVKIGQTEEDEGIVQIMEVFPRKNYFLRKATNLSKQTHILASNLDVVVILASLFSPRTSTGFIDRILVTAQAYDIPALLLLNKRDTWDVDNQSIALELVDRYRNIGYEANALSALYNEDIEWLRKELLDKVALFIGHSGAGKSTLLNAVEPGLGVRVGEISKKHQKGTHTTTFAEMFKLRNGGWIIDTPGIKEFGLFEISDRDLSDYFPEFLDRRQHCKFPNCSHIQEPKCAVIDALEKGEISLSRYENYLQMRLSNHASYHRK